MNRLFSTNRRTALLVVIVLLLTGYSSKGQIISTVCGNGTPGYNGDGINDTLAEINYPGFLSFGGVGYGSLFIGDRLNYRVRQIKLGPGGIILTKAGKGINGFTGDGGLADSAEISIPGGVTVDKAGNLYFCDYDNHRVRKVTTLGIITTIAGTGVAGFSGDNGPATAAKFNFPLGITVDSVGNLFVADQHNNRIRKIDTAGIITTVVGTGTGGFSGDLGPATIAEISLPNYVRMDSVGNLYVTDNGHHRIRKVDTFGIINTIAGNGTLGSSGDGGPATAAELNYPGGVAINKEGDIFICDCYNNCIRRIDAVTGIITKVAGTGTAGYSGDWGPATAAELNQPVDITVDHYDNVYFVDWNNSRIRKFSTATITCDTVTGISVSMITSTSAYISWTAVAGSLGYDYVVNTTATTPTVPGTYTGATNVTDTGLLPGVTYYAHVRDSCGVGSSSAWVTIPFTTLAAATCDTVMGITITAITPTSATVSWTAVAGALGYEYVVNTSAAAPTAPGTATTSTSVAVTGLIAGQNYYAHVLDSCGAASLSAWATQPFMTTLGAINVTGSSNFGMSAFPNPVDGLLTIRIDGRMGANAQLTIADVTGRIVATAIVTEQTTRLDVTGLHTGVYFVRYIDNDRVQTVSVVKN